MAIENVLSEPSAGLAELYEGFRQEHLAPLWTEIGDLMPASPLTDTTELTASSASDSRELRLRPRRPNTSSNRTT